MEKITYIITHKESTNDRRSNLEFILEWLNHIELVNEVIIVEQDSETRISNIIESNINRTYNLRHQFIYNPNNFFNKSWAFNVGIKLASNKWLAFGDNDVYMNPNTLDNIIRNSINVYDSFAPYEIIYDLSIKETNIIKSNNNYSDIQKRHNSIRGGAPYGGGLFFIKKESIISIGAWNEDFKNWGAEDEEITHRICKNLNYKMYNYNAYHLFHTRTIHSTFQNKFYNDNIQILLKNRDKDLEDLILDFDYDKIGLIDKYTIS